MPSAAADAVDRRLQRQRQAFTRHFPARTNRRLRPADRDRTEPAAARTVENQDRVPDPWISSFHESAAVADMLQVHRARRPVLHEPAFAVPWKRGRLHGSILVDFSAQVAPAFRHVSMIDKGTDRPSVSSQVVSTTGFQRSSKIRNVAGRTIRIRSGFVTNKRNISANHS